MIVGFQEWRELLFLHWAIPARELVPPVHPRLSVDERDGSAWVSMTPFTLRNGRLRGLPPLPDFHELNFRTYVSHPRRQLWTGPVVHEPWPLFQATVAEVSEDLSVAAGLRPLGRPSLCQWSPGVSVAFEHFRPA